MSEQNNPAGSNITDAVLAQAESRTGEGVADTSGNGAGGGGGTNRLRGALNGGDGHENGRHGPAVEGIHFTIGAGVERAARGRPYERKPGDPLYRPLRIYTSDPTASALEGATATVNVPYEPLKPGPVGHVFAVVSDEDRPLDLNHPFVVLGNGLTPSPSDRQFHKQMVYAVSSLVYATFRTALGRHVAWGFDAPVGTECKRVRLTLKPHEHLENAQALLKEGALDFGRVVPRDTAPDVPKHTVFACVSHDLIAHELTHALIDGLRTHFSDRTSNDVTAFHEGFADVVALLQHFSYPEVVRAAIRRSRGKLSQDKLLFSIAREFGRAREKLADGQPGPVRIALRVDEEGELQPLKYDEAVSRGDHEGGAVLVSAVLHAFIKVYTRKTERYVRLATAGTGILPDGELPADLQVVLAEEASKLASQFLNVCIRAIDYCPAVDVQMSEFLRAVITADLDLVPHDPWGYREAWIDSFRTHHIIPKDVESMAEVDLQWDPPIETLRRLRRLSFKHLRFEGDPGRPSGRKELRRQARALGECVARNLKVFGMAEPGVYVHEDKTLQMHADVKPPQVQSIRASRRVGPDGQVVFDLVAEVTQRCAVRHVNGEMRFFGAATVILGPRGEVRYVVYKRTLDDRRMLRQWNVRNSKAALVPETRGSSNTREEAVVWTRDEAHAGFDVGPDDAPATKDAAAEANPQPA